MARKPRTSETQLRADYLDYAENMAANAETGTNGVLWSRRGTVRLDSGQIVAWELFSRPWAHVACYASEELRAWFEDHGRMSFTDYRDQVRGYNREAYADYLESLTENV